MTTVTATRAREDLDRLLDEAPESRQPIHFAVERNSAVLVSEADWRAMRETLHLVSIPGMSQSIREGLEAPVEQM